MPGDDYATSRSAYEVIKPFIPNDITIYDPFYFNGKCKQYMEEVFSTCVIIHENKDAFSWFPVCDMIITNPPFSNKYEVLNWLIEQDKPFCCLLPLETITTKKFRNVPKFDELQFIIKAGRIKFEVEG